MGVGGSSSSSKPKDMTPAAFKALQGPFASVFASLLGFGPPGNGQGGNGTGMGAVGVGGNPGSQYYQYGPVGANGQPLTPQPVSGTGATRGRLPGASGGSRQVGGNAGHASGRRSSRADAMFGAANQQPIPTAPPQFPTTGGDPNDILAGIPKYQGQITSEIGANEQAILDQLMQMQGGGQTAGSGGPNSEALAYLSKVMSGEFMPGEMDTDRMSEFTKMLRDSAQTTGYQMGEQNPFLNAAIEAAQRPTLQGLEETLSRTLPGRFTEAGQFKQPGGSSAFDRAGAIATRGASDALADIATNLSYTMYEAERGRQFEAQEGARAREDAQMKGELDRIFGARENERNRQNEAAGLTSTVKAQEVDNMVKNLQAQALPRLINEFGIERGIEQFNNQVNTLLAVLGIAGGVTAPTIGNSQKSSSMQASIK